MGSVWHRAIVLGVCLFTFTGGAVCAQTQPATQPATQKADGEHLPGIRIDRDAGYVQIEAKVIHREAKWLELLVCSPGSREHETILTSPAKPSHIHLALLALGLVPGSPIDSRQAADGEGLEVVPPKGPKLALFCLWEADGQPHRAPANTWVRHQKTGDVLAGNTWLFTGSQFHVQDGRRLYMADLNGTIVSLVNFGDDLLTRPTTTTNRTDEQAWGTNMAAIPPVGTKVRLRMVPIGADGAEQVGGADEAPGPGDDGAGGDGTGGDGTGGRG